MDIMSRINAPTILAVIITMILVVSPVIALEKDWSISISGPDGTITMNRTAFENAAERNGSSFHFNPETTLSGIPVWRIVRMVDTGKTLGPGDNVIISGTDKKTTIPFESVYKQDGYLLVTKLNGDMLPESITGKNIPPGPVIYVDPLFPTGNPVGGVESVRISNTDEWSLNVSDPDETIRIPKEEFSQMVNEKGVTAKGPDSMELKGIPVSQILTRLHKKPESGSIITVSGTDGYKIDIPYQKISAGERYLVASEINGEPVPKYLLGLFAGLEKIPAWPLILVDPQFPGNDSVTMVDSIRVK